MNDVWLPNLIVPSEANCIIHNVRKYIDLVRRLEFWNCRSSTFAITFMLPPLPIKENQPTVMHRMITNLFTRNLYKGLTWKFCTVSRKFVKHKVPRTGFDVFSMVTDVVFRRIRETTSFAASQNLFNRSRRTKKLSRRR